MVERLILVHSDRGQAVDGIRDHTRIMARELARHSLAVTEFRILTAHAPGGRVGGSVQIWRRLRRLGPSSAVAFQYSPFCYGRWGFAPWLPAYLLAIRAARPRPTLLLMVHECYVPMLSWRWTLMGIWQRVQLGALRIAADVVLTSIEPWARELEAMPPGKPVHHLPVGSNFPDGRAGRERERRRLEVDERTLVIACLGRDHPSWLGAYVVDAVNAIARAGNPLLLLNLGAEAPLLDGLGPGVAVHAPGFLEPERFAAVLAASDLFLLPTVDGVSTRRGSLMAALQHGLPVVATAGPLTDPILRETGSALRLVEVGDSERFSRAAARLAADGEARATAGVAARELYERDFDWPVIARKLLATLPDS
jgi:glycosyltransferase involved in cell wall biosynthesis